ncbi:MAG: M23 family metallopeptidase [Alphaproteobacteria bacterium]|nr:M23 family metallopeptidase [Alphaproteobacteria bacterium]
MRALSLAAFAFAFAGGCTHSGAAPVRYGADEAQGAKTRPQEIRVDRGDTLYSIARAHEVDVAVLARANGIAPPYTIFAGQRLRLPAPPTHRVTKGETLDRIARDYLIDREELAALNGKRYPFHVRAGETLRLPPDAARSTALANAAPPPAGKTKVAAATPKPKPAPAAKTDRSKREAPVTRTAYSHGKSTAKGRALAWPAEGRILSTFGAKSGGLYNDGINIALAEGTPIRAAEDGVVVYQGAELKAFGNLVLVEHEGGVITAYAHNARARVRKGERVTRGQIIAHAGRTGSVSEPQLHFEVRDGTRPKNPLDYLEARKIVLTSR